MSTKMGLRGCLLPRVDEDAARLQLESDTLCTNGICAPDARGEARVRVIGSPNDVGLVSPP